MPVIIGERICDCAG